MSSPASPGIRASTAHARAIYPFLAETGLGWRGCLIGSDSSGGAFCFDPWELYHRGMISSPNVIVLGEIGHGKSALLKTLLWRMLLFGRRAFVLDVKGEYAPLCQAARVTPVRLAPGNGVRLSARDPGAQVQMLRAVAGTAVRRPLSAEEAGVLREALTEVNRQHDQDHDDEATIPRVLELLFEPTPDMCTRLRTNPTELAAARFEAMSATRDPGRLISVADEAWKILEHEGLALWFRQNFKLARQYGVMNIVVAHKAADLAGAGDQGTARQAAARGLMSDCAIRVVYRQAAAELDSARALLGLSDRECQIVAQLGKGQALWQVGERSFVVQHHRSRIERTLTDTDQGMHADRRTQTTQAS